jgi:ribosome-associated toxin RatA of RatAB toxin-antitoxin module
MHTLKRSSIVPYTQQQMFELVNNIEDYPNFLPWCDKTEIISRTESHVVARLDIAWKGMGKSLTTRNTLHRYDHMDIELVDGPMKHLEGKWDFVPVGEKGCKVLLNLEFEFTGGFMDMLFQPVFQHIANSLVDAFCKRAVEIYGNH